MFGFSHFFGDIVDLIEDRHDCLSMVVVNVPEKMVPGRPTLAERISRLPYDVEIVKLDEFKPSEPQYYVMGFPGKKMVPLLSEIRKRIGIERKLEALIHSKSMQQAGSKVGEGSMVNAGAILGPWSEIGKHAIVNRGANIGHDVKVGGFSFVSPGAVLCGHVVLGENVFVGANATILPDVRIGENAIVAAGAVVTGDIPPNVMVAGVPAAVKKTVGDAP